MAITRRGRKMRRTKKTHKKHAKRTRKSRRNMRGGKHAYIIEDKDRMLNNPRFGSSKTGKNRDDVISILNNNSREKISNTDNVFGEHGDISEVRRMFKDERENYFEIRPDLKTRVGLRGIDNFMKRGSYNDLYWDLESFFGPEREYINLTFRPNNESNTDEEEEEKEEGSFPMKVSDV
jgi:hypothetical protein